jgi:hypothetical protein
LIMVAHKTMEPSVVDLFACCIKAPQNLLAASNHTYFFLEDCRKVICSIFYKKKGHCHASICFHMFFPFLQLLVL